MSKTNCSFAAVSILAALVSGAAGQAPNLSINAPYAQNLIVTSKAAHPELQKLGLHVIPPGEQEYFIIANAIPSKIGKKSSAGDIEVIRAQKPAVKNVDKDRFFDLGLPVSDSEGRSIGMCVMEIPYAFAKDPQEAVAKATVVRDELQRKIANRAQLFEQLEPLSLKDSIELPASVKGAFDHFATDLTHHRLFATAEDSHAVLVFDTNTAKQAGEIPGIGRPHAVFYRADLDRIFVTDGQAGALKIFDGRNYQPRGSVALAKDADSIGYDVSRGYLYVVNGGKDVGEKYSLLSVVDTTAEKTVAEIRIEGETLEAMALDVFRPRVYVNNRATNRVMVIDRLKNTVTASWPVTLGKDNVALAVDEQHQRLFVGCRDGSVAVIDSNTGRELEALTITKGVDDMEFDATSKRLYAIGGGMIDVFEQLDADHYKSLGKISAGGPAKTGRLVPQLARYYAAKTQTATSNAAIQGFEILNIPPVKPQVAEVARSVHAPFALQLDLATMSAHPDLRKMGLHATPPGAKESVIIANANVSRIGIKSSEGDLAAVMDGKTYCVKRDDGAFFNAKLPLHDAAARTIGILVMEIPFTSVANEAEAVHKAEQIRSELAAQIPNYDRLFQ
jgi:DNA-binding beta-propeller fold protein YncE